jgi:SAM-dependent methyltransferase
MVKRKVKSTPLPHEYSEWYFLENWDGAEKLSRGEFALRHLKALEYLGVHPGDLILDIGCGRGEFLYLCARNGGIVIGLDYSPAAIRILSGRKYSNVTIIQASATMLPFRDNVFDKVVMLDFVEHVAPDDLRKCLEDVGKVLKPRGQLLIHTPNQWGDYALSFYDKIVSRLRLPLWKPRAYYSLHVNVLNPISLRRTLRAAGFESRIWFARHPLRDMPRYWLALDKIMFFLTTLWCRASKA